MKEGKKEREEEWKRKGRSTVLLKLGRSFAACGQGGEFKVYHSRLGIVGDAEGAGFCERMIS